MFQVTPGDDEDLDDIYAAIPAEFKAVRRASQASMGTAEPPPVPTRNPALRKSLKKLMKEHATTVATHQSEEVKKDEVGGFGFGDAGDSPQGDDELQTTRSNIRRRKSDAWLAGLQARNRQVQYAGGGIAMQAATSVGDSHHTDVHAGADGSLDAAESADSLALALAAEHEANAILETQISTIQCRASLATASPEQSGFWAFIGNL